MVISHDGFKVQCTLIVSSVTGVVADFKSLPPHRHTGSDSTGSYPLGLWKGDVSTGFVPDLLLQGALGVFLYQ